MSIYVKGTSYKINNTVTAVGSLTINGTVVSGFSTSNYLKITGGDTVSDVNLNSFEILIKITTPTTWISNGRILNPTDGADSTTCPFIEANNYGIAINFWNSVSYDRTVALSSPASNTTYWCKWIYDGTKIKGYYSIDGINFTLNEERVAGYKYYFYSNEFSVGVRSFDSAAVTVYNGSVDLSQFYIKVNGDMWLRGAYELLYTQIKEVYKNGQSIAQIYNGSTLVYTNFDNRILTGMQDYDNMVSPANAAINYASEDIWAIGTSGTNGTDYIDISYNSDMSNSLRIYYNAWHAGYTSAKGGDIVFVPKGYYFRISSGTRWWMPCVTPGKLASNPSAKYVPQPDYDNRMSYTADTFVNVTEAGGRWYYLEPASTSAKQLVVKVNSTGAEYTINTSNSYGASADKGSTLSYIPGNGKYSVKVIRANGWYCLTKLKV